MTASGFSVQALHGFLGLSSDWNSVPLECEAVDLWRDLEALPKGAPFRVWAQIFNERVRRTDEKPVLMGYSMGGRLAMSAVLSDPSVYRALILISANPGMSDGRVARKAHDEKWAERFSSSEKWTHVLKDWNEQSVLKSPASKAALSEADELVRAESSFSRPLLARSLREWSLAEQPDFRGALTDLKLPVLFITGQEDQKFTEIMKGLTLADQHRLVTIENAGHRVPWDQPSGFARVVRDFLATV